MKIIFVGKILGGGEAVQITGYKRWEYTDWWRFWLQGQIGRYKSVILQCDLLDRVLAKRELKLFSKDNGAICVGQ